MNKGDNGMEFDDRLVTSEVMESDGEQYSLRPRTLEEYIGQDKVKQNISVFIEAALKRNEALDHVLLFGPPGLGKTTLANIIANELHVNMRVTSGPAIMRQGDLAAILSTLSEGEVLFIDEIHRLPKAAPLRDRFGVQCRLEFYQPEQLRIIVNKSAEKLDVEMTPEGALEIARRSRGTPRVANRLLKRVRDFAQVLGQAVIDQKLADEALSRLEVDRYGLDQNDRRILQTIVRTFGGGPVGVDTIAAAVSEEAGTIEDVVEPYLMQLGLLQRTPRGRVATRETYRYLGIPYPEDASGKPKVEQPSLL